LNRVHQRAAEYAQMLSLRKCKGELGGAVKLAFMMRSLIMLAVLFVSALYCSVNASAGESARLSGKVTDVEGKPVEGAVIFIYDSAVTRRQPDFISPGSDKDGRFSISLPPGRYWAVARARKDEKSGPLISGGRHSGEPMEIEMSLNGDLERDFVVADIREVARMTQKTRKDVIVIRGRVLDSEGKPVRMAYAIADKGEHFSGMPDFFSGWTDAEGNYALYLPRGKYFIGAAVSFPPYQGYSFDREVLIETDKVGLDIVIKPR